METEPMDQDEEIRRYLAGEMTPEELQVFEAQLESDAELKGEIIHFSTINSVLDKEAADFSDEVMKVITANRKTTKTWWWVAAAIPLLALSFYFLSQQKPVRDLDQLSSYFEPYPDIISSRATEDGTVDMSGYNKGNYWEAAQSLSQVHKEESHLIGLYLAISYIKTERPEQAIEILNRSMEKSHPLYYEYAWYKSYALIEAGRIEDALPLLTIVAEGNSTFSRKAEEILKALGT